MKMTLPYRAALDVGRPATTPRRDPVPVADAAQAAALHRSGGPGVAQQPRRRRLALPWREHAGLAGGGPNGVPS
jgi:hypothetical protein